MADGIARYSIDALNLPARARNALVRAGITTLENLAARSDAELLLVRGFGPTSLAQVREQLAAWEREHLPAEALPAEEPSAEPEDREEYEQEPLTILPGRQVLHATWFPGSPGHLFLWGEGKPLSPATPGPPSEIPNPQSAIFNPPSSLPHLPCCAARLAARHNPC